MTGITILGIVLIVGGFALRYWMNRRRFNRNNFAGVQTFRSYEHKFVILPIERWVKIIGLLLMLAGAFFIWMERTNKKFAEKHQQQEKQQQQSRK